MKVCFVVPDGVGVRNYLFSPLISDLVEMGASISVWHRLDNKIINDIQSLHGIKIESFTLSYSSESFLGRLFKEASVYARLKRNAELDNNPSTLLDWVNRSGSWRRRFLFTFSKYVGEFLKSYENIIWAENFHSVSLKKTNAFKAAVQVLKRNKPDLIFCTHQRSPEAALAVEAAKYLGIPTITVIYSWDNLPKAKLAVKADYFLVWSEYMKAEMGKYYPEIKSERVIISGTPQFDFYKQKEFLKTREEFAIENDLNPRKTWICFSGDDFATSPFDELYLRDIAQEISDMEDIELIFRPVPVSDASRYKLVLKEFPQIKVIKPMWSTSEMWSYSLPMYEDISMLSNLVYHCSTVLNVGSTMALDFACFDHPALYLNYLPKGGKKQVWDPSKIYGRQHFRSMGNLEAVGWINDFTQLKEKINEAINSPKIVGRDRLKWLDVIREDNPKITSSNKISSIISNII
ncbi:hypothetical protein E4S40_00745 [Algoriphagus kandeliae]|uniref:UDP-glycosyltransferase n=1 Tax=Algoriphagus kandeliae TaxID=2562278 RepID=A0A4Y9R1K7_9BACT|nr:hypothetical protein [Algoriphagus kandeliae]TFV97216.1 hypothetical protein E4S40_00745 [Algoriphagus kandeliae]